MDTYEIQETLITEGTDDVSVTTVKDGQKGYLSCKIIQVEGPVKHGWAMTPFETPPWLRLIEKVKPKESRKKVKMRLMAAYFINADGKGRWNLHNLEK